MKQKINTEDPRSPSYGWLRTSKSHNQFVDDKMIVGQATEIAAKRIINILKDYEGASQQKVNRQRRIAEIFNRQIGSLPYTYLGMPLFQKHKVTI